MPRGNAGCNPVFAGYFSLNGNGEMTGMHWVEESGLTTGRPHYADQYPQCRYRAGRRYRMANESRLKLINPGPWPVVAETFDGII